VFLPFQYTFSSAAIEWEAADLGAVGVEAGAGELCSIEDRAREELWSSGAR